MKKKNGFTLVELVISITLLAIIGISIGISLNKVFTSRNNSENEVVANKIKSAADVYLSSNASELNKLYSERAYLLIKISTLKDAGLLEEKLRNPDTGLLIDDDETVMATLDEAGTIKYDYPVNESNEEYLQALNVYLEQGEKVSCTVGEKTYNLAMVDTKGKFELDSNNKIKTIENMSCDWDESNSKTTGTYKVKYTYTLSSGVTKSITRKFIVQKKVDVTLIGTTNDSTNTKIPSGTWTNKPFTISIKTDRAANLKNYIWTPGNLTNDSIKIDSTQDSTYTLKYDVYNINSNVKAYNGTATYNAKLELQKEIYDEDNPTNTYTPILSGGKEEWQNTPVEFTVSAASSTPISGIDHFEYSIDKTNWKKIEDNKFSVDTLGKNTVYVRIITKAGNHSGNATGSAWFDNVAPNLKDGTASVSGTNLGAEFEDNESGVAGIFYSANTVDNPLNYSIGTWSNNSVKANPPCSTTFYYYAYAIDNAGNIGERYKLGEYTNSNSCGYTYTPTYDYSGGGSTPVADTTCDAACKIVIIGNWWQTNCPNCSQKDFSAKATELGGFDAGGQTFKNYDEVIKLRADNGLYTNKDGNCTINVTCEMYGLPNVYDPADPYGLNDLDIPDLSNLEIPDMSGLADLSIDLGDLDFSGLADMDLSGLDDLGNMDLSGLDSIGDINIPPIECLAEGTKILMADGTTKNIEDIDYDDLLTTWSYDTGTVTYNYPGWIEKKHTSNSYYHTEFSDGSYLNTIGYHSVYDCDKNKFVNINNPDEVNVGTHIMNVVNGHKSCVTVTSVGLVNEPINYYHIESVRYLNVIANNILTTDGYPMLSNIYGFTDNAKWPTKKVMMDNLTRNLFTLEEIQEDNKYYTKHLYEAMGSATTKYLTPYADLKNDVQDQILSLRLSFALIDPGHVLPYQKDSDGNNLWKVSTSDNYKTSNDMIKEGTNYTLPEPKNTNKFHGWYNTGDNKIYYPGNKVKIYYATHFVAIYN